MEEKRIEVSLVKDSIATCNACLVGNYESSVASSREKVDKLYEVRIDRMCLRLCKHCLLELIGEAASFLSDEEVSK